MDCKRLLRDNDVSGKPPARVPADLREDPQFPRPESQYSRRRQLQLYNQSNAIIGTAYKFDARRPRRTSMTTEDHRDDNRMDDPIHTYHCLCSTFILASVFALTDLPMRKPPAQDRAYILPSSIRPKNDQDDATHNAHLHVTARTLNAASDRKPVVVRREDGFEKRTLVRCGRCNLVLGYRLVVTPSADEVVEDDKVIYILPGALTSTTEMVSGQKPADTGLLIATIQASP